MDKKQNDISGSIFCYFLCYVSTKPEQKPLRKLNRCFFNLRQKLARNLGAKKVSDIYLTLFARFQSLESPCARQNRYCKVVKNEKYLLLYMADIQEPWKLVTSFDVGGVVSIGLGINNCYGEPKSHSFLPLWWMNCSDLCSMLCYAIHVFLTAIRTMVLHPLKGFSFTH